MKNCHDGTKCCSGSGALMLAALLLLGGLSALVYFNWPQPKPEAVAMRAMVWTCIKHPEIRRAEPGFCPICGRVLWPEDEGPQPAASAKDAGVYAEKSELMPRSRQTDGP